MSTLKFDSSSGILIQEREDKENLEKNNSGEEYITFGIYYSAAATKVSKIINLIDVATFIGSVGGNLGLFLGFSFLGGLYAACEFLSKIKQNIVFYTVGIIM